MQNCRDKEFRVSAVCSAGGLLLSMFVGHAFTCCSFLISVTVKVICAAKEGPLGRAL
jgi:hypothetical protein